MDNHGLFLHCGNSEILVPRPFTRSKIISARKLTNKPHDSIFFRSKINIITSTSSALISLSLPNCFSTTFTVGHPQRISARRLISTTTTLAHHGKISSSLSSSSSNNHHDHKSKLAKISSSSSAGAGASLAFSCVLGILCCGSIIALMLPNKAKACHRPDMQFFIPKRTVLEPTVPEPCPDVKMSPLSSISVMDGFLRSVLYLTSPKDVTLSDLPMFYDIDVLEDKKQALNLIKSGKTGEALQLLKSKSENADHPRLKYYYEMTLVEVLISLGKFDEALNIGCLNYSNSNIGSDIRRDFYKAIIYSMMKDKKETAEECWRDFLRQGFK